MFSLTLSAGIYILPIRECQGITRIVRFHVKARYLRGYRAFFLSASEINNENKFTVSEKPSAYCLKAYLLSPPLSLPLNSG